MSTRARATMAIDPPTMSGAANARRSQRRALEPAEQEGEDLAQVRAGQEHRHRQARGEQRANRVAGQEEPRQRGERPAPRRAGRRPPPRRAHRRTRGVEQAEIQEDAARNGIRTAMAAPRAAPDAVPSTYGSASGLRSRPWNAAPATASPPPTDDRGQDARQAQLQDDRLRGRRTTFARSGGRWPGGGSRACRRARGRRSRLRRPRRRRPRGRPRPTTARTAGRGPPPGRRTRTRARARLSARRCSCARTRAGTHGAELGGRGGGS